MIFGVLTTCHTQHTWDSSICVFLFNRTTLQVFVTYVTGALYVHPLWFYKHQHDNWIHSACQQWWFQWRFWLIPSVTGYTHPVSWNCAYHVRMELSDGGCFLNLVRNCHRTVVPRQSFWITLYVLLMFCECIFDIFVWVPKSLVIVFYLQVFSSAKYPASDVYSDYHSIFKSDVPLHLNRCPAKISSRHMPLESRVLQVCLLCPFYIFLVFTAWNFIVFLICENISWLCSSGYKVR